MSSVSRYLDDIDPEAREIVLAHLLACIDVTGRANRDDVRTAAINAVVTVETPARLRLV